MVGINPSSATAYSLGAPAASGARWRPPPRNAHARLAPLSRLPHCCGGRSSSDLRPACLWRPWRPEQRALAEKINARPWPATTTSLFPAPLQSHATLSFKVVPPPAGPPAKQAWARGAYRRPAELGETRTAPASQSSHRSLFGQLETALLPFATRITLSGAPFSRSDRKSVV